MSYRQKQSFPDEMEEGELDESEIEEGEFEEGEIDSEADSESQIHFQYPQDKGFSPISSLDNLSLYEHAHGQFPGQKIEPGAKVDLFQRKEVEEGEIEEGELSEQEMESNASPFHSPPSTPKGPSPQRLRFSPSTPLMDELEEGEIGSASPSVKSEESFKLPPDVLKYYDGQIGKDLEKEGIGKVDFQAVFQNETEPYIFTSLIARGAYASVFKATTYHDMNARHRQEVAIKVLRPGGLSNLLTILMEVQILLKLVERPHINVLTCNECFQGNSPTTYYVVSELAPLGDLYDVLCQKNPRGVEIWEAIKPQYCRHIIRGIARGVRHLFSLGISHADVKAENVLIFWNNKPALPNEDLSVNRNFRYMRMVPKLTDFSNSQQCEPGGPIMCVGAKCTAYTAAPETWFHDNIPYDGKKADVYSVGALLLSMLLGCHPFAAPLNCPGDLEIREIIILKKSMNFVKQLVQSFEPRLKQLLLRSLEPLPQNRITIEEFLSADWFTQRMAPQELEERWESTLWRGMPQRKVATRARLKSY